MPWCRGPKPSATPILTRSSSADRAKRPNANRLPTAEIGQFPVFGRRNTPSFSPSPGCPSRCVAPRNLSLNRRPPHVHIMMYMMPAAIHLGEIVAGQVSDGRSPGASRFGPCLNAGLPIRQRRALARTRRPSTLVTCKLGIARDAFVARFGFGSPDQDNRPNPS